MTTPHEAFEPLAHWRQTPRSCVDVVLVFCLFLQTPSPLATRICEDAILYALLNKPVRNITRMRDAPATMKRHCLCTAAKEVSDPQILMPGTDKSKIVYIWPATRHHPLEQTILIHAASNFRIPCRSEVCGCDQCLFQLVDGEASFCQAASCETRIFQLYRAELRGF
eukprot:CAMPEP_0177530212 /NCGR_PEP_ID=MMETSP0369-20130122/53261_1 /TAXON_ID=447022 ORGANISM="Scrippsiella hangoei-like, Strain SHHI-4" /NCGR_SAMPLE_ID=MMETSP0369 /ASSEMBLY_ACC=CAM_ASM_000364 /LENGTH=166 /DNA_ID=CAMNT_0019011017 /DNA_START=58 /DNA_END=559 /DNA_ORIENTATION=-